MKGHTEEEIKINPFFYLGGRWPRRGTIHFATGKENDAL
jgi:hypothetical protein